MLVPSDEEVVLAEFCQKKGAIVIGGDLGVSFKYASKLCRFDSTD